jgi:hypothetical protein
MRRSTAAFLVRASFLIVLVPLDVYGLWTVLAHGWHVVGRVGGVGPCWTPIVAVDTPSRGC